MLVVCSAGNPNLRNGRLGPDVADNPVADVRDLDLSAIDLKLLTILDAVLAERNLSRAGRRLGMSQSAVSQALARLRVLLGDDLFERTGRGVRPTPRAVELAEPVSRALAILRDALRPASGFDAVASDRRFFLAMRPDVAHAFGARLYLHLPRSSRISLYIVNSRLSDIENDLRFGSPEIAVLSEPIGISGIHNELLFKEQLVVLARRGHPHIGDRLTAEVYLRLGHSVMSRSRPEDQSAVDAELDRRRIARYVPIALPSAAAVIALVAKTDLVTTVPKRLAGVIAEGLDLVVHDLPLPQPPLPIYLSWHERFDGDQGHQWLRETLRAIAREL